MKRRLSISSEKRIQKNIQNKRMFQASTSTNDIISNSREREGHFRCFLILGIDTSREDNPKPCILSMFPSRPVKFSDSEMKDIINFCYPQGFKQIPISSPLRNSKASAESSSILTGFVFYLQGKERLYGVVLHIRIPNDSKSFVGDKFDRSYPFGLCVISKYPDISSHFQFLSDIADAIVSDVKLPDRSVEVPEWLQNRTEKCLPSLLIHPKCPLIAVSMGVHSPRFLLPDILSYYSINFQPMLNTSDYLLYPTFQTLLSFFSSKDIVKIYTYILYEIYVVFTSTDMNRLSFCVLAATNLIKGLNIESKIFPVLPESDNFLPIFETPFPFIIGYPHRFDNVDVVIDIDKGKITENTALPKLPHSAKLIAQIDLLLSNYQAQMTIPSKTSFKTLLSKQKVNPEFIKFTSKADQRIYPKCFRDFADTKYIVNPRIIQSISKLFYKPFVPNLADFIKMHFVTDTTIRSNPVTVFNKEMFIYHIDDKFQDFMKYFSNTQMFQQFVEKLADEVQMNKNLLAVRKQQFKLFQTQINAIMKKLPKQRRKSYPKVLLPSEKPSLIDTLDKSP